MKKNVLITGGTGFIGKYLTNLLVQKGYTVAILSRTKKPNTDSVTYYTWNIEKNWIEEQAVLNANYIIHLAGENIAEKRWTSKRKEQIINSREQATQLIYSVLKKYDKKLEAFISASAIGYYGALNGEEICTENSPAAADFLGLTCKKWEDSTVFIERLSIRTVIIRTGLVLGKNDGFLKKLIPIFKLRLGSPLGSGKQYMPWIHVNDLAAIYLKSMEDHSLFGPYNAAVNDGTNNIIFSKTLARIFGYSIWLPAIPAFVLKIVMGEMSKIVLTGRRVSSYKIEKTGFQFQFSNLEEALKDCLNK